MARIGPLAGPMNVKNGIQTGPKYGRIYISAMQPIESCSASEELLQALVTVGPNQWLWR